ncbi:MAG TPA: nucleotidyltransferase [Thermoanaerobaculia bacterium]|nr:nucleotidyltransferase [Thermoanaerobaculia bacterium]
MPYTVPYSFSRFIENISLSGDHHDTAEARRKHLVSLLSNTFTIVDSFATGSIPRRTALKTHSDLDVFVVLHYGKHIEGKTPRAVLQSVRDALGDYRTNVRKNGQAVTLYYKTWPDVDIVPVSRVKNDDGSISHYNVPDMNSGEWIASRPKKHANAVDAKNKALDSRFKPLLRMAKEWNLAHSDLMQSYHIEVMGLKGITYLDDEWPWSVYQFFEAAAKLASSPLWHEEDFADNYLDYDSRKEAVRRLESARDKSREAWSCTYGGSSDHERAIQIWRQIFGDRFPAYG